ncbi:RHS repeat-associated core domain-containing protein, partial [Vibrio metschnikovii]
GEVVWQGEQALWGHYQQQHLLPYRGSQEEAINDALYCDLRYQGQIEDRESGLYYNVNRYYDADSGQYLSPDPIGFAGGLRPQAYVHNPLEWVDPLGLNSTILNRNMGGKVGDRLSAHHVIPVDVWNRNSDFFSDIGMGNMRDSATNGIFLPGSESAHHKDLGKGVSVYHSSSHKHYSDLVESNISDIRREFENGSISDRDARDAVRRTQMDHKNKLWRGDVPKNCKGRLI